MQLVSVSARAGAAGDRLGRNGRDATSGRYERGNLPNSEGGQPVSKAVLSPTSRRPIVMVISRDLSDRRRLGFRQLPFVC